MTDVQREREARNHRFFQHFWDWAEQNGCDSQHFGDWEAWWSCFLAGVNIVSAE